MRSSSVASDGRRQEEPAWRAVRRWPGLRGEAKLAWKFLSEFGGGVGSTVLVTAADLGADQGTSSTAGRRAIESLAVEGLVELVERAKGRWTVYLPDPLDVARARRSRGCDGQGELFELSEPLAEEPKPPPTIRVQAPATDALATDVSALPSPRATSATSENARATKDLDLGFKDFGDLGKSAARAPDAEARKRRDGSERATVATEALATEARVTETLPGVSRIDAVLLKIAGREAPSPPEQERRVEQWVELIRSRVADPRLRLAPVVRVATAVHEGRFADGELRRILAKLDDVRSSGRLTTEAWRYFVGACRRRFFETGLDWPTAAGGGA